MADIPSDDVMAMGWWGYRLREELQLQREECERLEYVNQKLQRDLVRLYRWTHTSQPSLLMCLCWACEGRRRR